MGTEFVTWIGIVFCVSQSAMFSGMNLAMFSFSRLKLDVEASCGSEGAQKILSLRKDSNFLLTTILWGNVGINVLLTLLADSVLAGVGAFLFSTVAITIFGEITPQAYFSRHVLKVALLLAPVLRLYQLVLFPVAKPCALVLDLWLGKEGVEYVREEQMREAIRQHIDAPEAADISRLEGIGALNFLSLDDLPVVMEGEPLDMESIIQVPWREGNPVFPDYDACAADPFIKAIEASDKRWVVLTDEEGAPRLVLDANRFLRKVLAGNRVVDPLRFCHRPVVVHSRSTRLGSVLARLQYEVPSETDDPQECDVILLWSETKRVITGVDILGRLMRGVSVPEPMPLQVSPG